MAGKQVAVLVPTTVLAEQHLRTLPRADGRVPVRDRHASAGSAREGRAEADRSTSWRAGKVDIVIGTHRLLSEGREVPRSRPAGRSTKSSGSASTHKEKLKQLRKRVDVLTLTATPIPRTLHMSLVGIRDISNIETPPKDRLAIQTSVVEVRRARSSRRAVRNELESARPGLFRPQPGRVTSIRWPTWYSASSRKRG